MQLPVLRQRTILEENSKRHAPVRRLARAHEAPSLVPIRPLRPDRDGDNLGYEPLEVVRVLCLDWMKNNVELIAHGGPLGEAIHDRFLTA